MYFTSAGVTPASLMAFVMALAAPAPSSCGDVIWYASDEQPYPTTSA